MKRFLVASGLVAALALAAVAAQSATAKHPARGNAACDPSSCPLCPLSHGVKAAAAQTTPASTAKVASCPVTDPSACSKSCPRISASAAKAVAVKPVAAPVAAR